MFIKKNFKFITSLGNPNNLSVCLRQAIVEIHTLKIIKMIKNIVKTFPELTGIFSINLDKKDI